MNSSQARLPRDHEFVPANGNRRDPWMRLAQVEAELAAQEPVIGAALLVATAFRLRDEAGLIDTLRRLAQAVAAHEVRMASNDEDA
jgi:hypothetical protein